MGVDMASRDELIAARLEVDEIANHLQVDSLGYLSLQGLEKVVGPGQGGHCRACFDGQYPVPTHASISKQMFESEHVAPNHAVVKDS
jgi:amidophosphoribosyltransferase